MHHPPLRRTPPTRADPAPPRCGAGATPRAGGRWLVAALAAVALLAPRAEGGAAPPAGRGAPAYETVAGDDWRAYRSKAELRAAGRFWWFRLEDVYRHVDLVPDRAFGQVARITFAASAETGFAPKLRASFPPVEKGWFRWRMRFSPGWTTVGPSPPGYANSYKIAFWLWDGYEGRGELEFSNTDEYVTLWMVRDRRGWLPYRKEHLTPETSFGRVTSEWRDGEWHEFVSYYEKTGPAAARQHWWRRRLTRGGAVAPGPWTYVGVALSGSPTPRMSGIVLGANKNKNNPTSMYIDWGPWEVVDGTRYPNPWGMPFPR
jgi:hypothetical protein